MSNLLLRRLTRQGGSLILRIPRPLVRARGWKMGDEFLVSLVGDALILRRVDSAALQRRIEVMVKDLVPHRRRR